VPNVSRVSRLSRDSFQPRTARGTGATGPLAGGSISSPFELHAPYDFEAAFKVARKRAGQSLCCTSPVFYVNHASIARLALEAKLPTIFQERDYVEAGGLISFGLNMADTFGRAAHYIDRLLKGAKPNVSARRTTLESPGGSQREDCQRTQANHPAVHPCCAQIEVIR